MVLESAKLLNFCKNDWILFRQEFEHSILKFWIYFSNDSTISSFFVEMWENVVSFVQCVEIKFEKNVVFTLVVIFE